MDSNRIIQLFVRSSSSHHDDGDASGSGSHSTAHSDHFVHSHPGTVLFLFVAIAVGGEYINNNNKKIRLRLIELVCCY